MSIQVVWRLFEAIEAGDVKAIADAYHENAEQVEYPNRLLPSGARRTKADLVEAARRGKALMAAQTVRIERIVDGGDGGLALQVAWSGQLAVDAPPLGLNAGDTIEARLAQFFTFHEGRILHHDTYDCISPVNAHMTGAVPEARRG